ncbi:MAG: hypothetical protein K2N52_01530, partial [Clostridia bacterium]|nr:hypothetical protein [Clostridia bacterium]
MGEIMQDVDLAPTQEAYYEEQSKQVLDDYKAVANMHLDEFGDVNYDDAEVQTAGKIAAAKLFAYACYNERTLDQYVFFSNMKADTNLGSNGSGTAYRQEYYLRVNETEKSCGYRYHYSLKKVDEAEGFIATFKNLFETASLRFTDQTDLLYRFSGSNIKYGRQNETLDLTLLECTWKTDTSKGDWGTHELKIQKRAPIAPEDIEEDIIANAGLEIKGQDTTTIRGNINILAENIIKYASISEDEDNGIINVMLTIDTEVANKDNSSLKMLRQSNDSSNCHWVAGENDDDATGIGEDTGFRLIYRLWPNGLFHSYLIAERWSGKIQGF